MLPRLSHWAPWCFFSADTLPSPEEICTAPDPLRDWQRTAPFLSLSCHRSSIHHGQKEGWRTQADKPKDQTVPDGLSYPKSSFLDVWMHLYQWTARHNLGLGTTLGTSKIHSTPWIPHFPLNKNPTTLTPPKSQMVFVFQQFLCNQLVSFVLLVLLGFG